MATYARARRIGSVAALIVLATALAACGGSSDKKKATDDASTPPTKPAVGAYKLVTEVTESTIKSNKAGTKSKADRTIYLSCADAECTRLFQRGAGSTGVGSLTVELGTDSEATKLDGSWAVSRTCSEDSKAPYSEEIAWSWTRAADGVLNGSIVQTVKGCDLDGVATYTATATPLPDETVPYLDVTATPGFIAAWNSYEAELEKARTAVTACADKDLDTISLKDTGCDAKFYRTVSAGVTTLGAAIDALGAPATTACGKGIADLRAEEWAAKFASLAKVNSQAKTTAGIRKAYNQGEASSKYVQARYDGLLLVAAMCVNPVEARSFGENGKSIFDPNQRLVPKP